MVTFRRAVRTEEDRQGGYGLTPVRRSGSPAVTEDFSIDVADDFAVSSEHAFTPAHQIDDPIETFTRSKEREFKYSERKEYPQTAEFVGYAGINAPTRVKKAPKRPKEDFMPSIAVQREEQVLTQSSVEPTRREQKKVSPRSKAMLMLYMGVVAIVAIVVMVLNVAIGNISADVVALETAVSERQSIIYEQNAQIEMLTDRDYVSGVATTEKGMQKVSAPVEIELAEFGESITYSKRTNWFDRFCDWLNNVTGG